MASVLFQRNPFVEEAVVLLSKRFKQYFTEEFFSLSENLKAYTPTAISLSIRTSLLTRHTYPPASTSGAVDSAYQKTPLSASTFTTDLAFQPAKSRKLFPIVIGYFHFLTHVQYHILRSSSYDMSSSSAGGRGGRGFGLSGTRRTPLRQQPTSTKWTKVTNTKQTSHPIELLGDPAPPTREKVERKFNMYVVLALGHPRKSTPQKVELLRQFFSFIREVDKTAAIQPYMENDPVNSICHPSHILDKVSDFEHYFPEVKYYHRRIRTKCRLTTSVDIKDIKQKIFDKLRANDFWIEPTTIKCQETTRCGFFLYAHPDFTYRSDIISILQPILAQAATSNIPLEFDVQPEKLNVTVNGTKVGERVVMLRSTPTHSEKIQHTLTQLFAADNTTDITTLRKYMFVPLMIVGDDNKTTLQGLLRTQQLFRQNVYHYIINGMTNITHQFQVLAPSIENTDNDSQPDNTDATQERDSDSPSDSNTSPTTSNNNDGNTSQTPQSTENATKPPTEPYSLREWFYDLTDVDNEPLIHALYPSSDASKSFLLCEKGKSVKVLQLLHNVVDLVGIDFPNEALTTYFGTEHSNPSVHNHPKATVATTAYSQHLTAYATTCNPQDETPPPNPAEPARNAKRTRDGAPLQNMTYASAATSTPNAPSYGADVDNLLSKLQNNLTSLENIDSKHKYYDDTLQQFGKRFEAVESGLQGHGKLLNALSETQEKQGKLMENMDKKLEGLTNLLKGPPKVTQDTNTTQDVIMTSPLENEPPNPSHGGLEGMEP